MKNKIILITGASSGIGKAAALEIARQGASLIIHGRDLDKTEAVKQDIINQTGNRNIDTVIADLFVLNDIRRMAASISEKYERLDVLINNAGAMMSTNRELTADGIEKTIALNLVAPYLLTWLLLNTLKKSEEARVINVASGAHHFAFPYFTDLTSERRYSPFNAYNNAKLYEILMTERFAATLTEQGINHVTVNAMHPGAIGTNFLNKDLGFFMNTLGKLSRPFFKSPAKGADTIVWMAGDDSMKNHSGLYFEKRKQAIVNKRFNTGKNQEMVWAYCRKVTGQE